MSCVKIMPIFYSCFKFTKYLTKLIKELSLCHIFKFMLISDKYINILMIVNDHFNKIIIKYK